MAAGEMLHSAHGEMGHLAHNQALGPIETKRVNLG